MRRAIETIGFMALFAGAAAMDSTKVAIPSVMIIGGITIIYFIERSLRNG